jgi:type I restriction enzyme S subunit
MGAAVQLIEYKLGELINIKHGYAFKSKYFSDSGEKIVTTPGNFIDTGGFKYKGKDKEKWYEGPVPEGFELKKGQLIVAMTEQMYGLLGSSAIIPDSNLYLHNQRLGLVENIEGQKLDETFLYYLFNAKYVRDQIQATANGAKVRHTSIQKIYDVKINLPPLTYQQCVGKVLASYDSLIENNNRRIAILEDVAQSLYREWFVKFRFPGHENVKFKDSPLGQIPEGWEVKRLDDFVVLQRGFDLPKKKRNEEGGIPIYAASGINGYHDEAKTKAPGLVTGRSGTLGVVKVVLEDFWPLNTSLWVKEFKNCSAYYAYYLLAGLDLERFNSGASVPTLNRNDVHGHQLISPPVELIAEFELVAKGFFQQIEVLTKKNKNLSAQRDMLLPRLISGSIEL